MPKTLATVAVITTGMMFFATPAASAAADTAPAKNLSGYAAQHGSGVSYLAPSGKKTFMIRPIQRGPGRTYILMIHPPRNSPAVTPGPGKSATS